MTFVRVEQLYPLPQKQIDAVLAKYKNAENIIWGQEEPENMGAWTFMAMNMRHIDLKCVARRASAAPAAGAKEIHLRRLKKLYENLFQYVAVAARSEEHTSELQSRPHRVCRLLLEKKKHM